MQLNYNITTKINIIVLDNLLHTDDRDATEVRRDEDLRFEIETSLNSMLILVALHFRAFVTVRGECRLSI